MQNDTSDKNQRPVKKNVKRAIALGYEAGRDEAPRVLAAGQGFIADKILEIAKQQQLPIREDPILAEALSQVDLNKAIPPELYAVVAEVFSFVYRIKKKKITS
jgi:flagellar biosynthesis protein